MNQVNRDVKVMRLLTEIAAGVLPATKKATPLVAAITRRGEILTVGIARKKSHPLQRKYSSSPEHIYLHAEIDAIQRAIRQGVDLTRCEIHVCRIKQTVSGEQIWGLAKPCYDGCEPAIRAFGIRRAIWTTESTELNQNTLQEFLNYA